MTIKIDWSAFDWPESTVTCKCEMVYRSHSKMVATPSGLTVVTRKPCPGCGQSEGNARRVSSNPEVMTIGQTRSPMPTMDERVARLLRQYRIGERVRAVETIIYGTGEEVPEGTVGVVRHTNVHGCTPLVTVEWEGLPPIGHPVVSVESLEPVDRKES